MTRRKVTLAYIANDSERKASFNKRKKGLIKKMSELSTLCNVEACAIIYSPYNPEPEVWPSLLGAQAVLTRFGRLPEMDRTRKMVNQESFIRQRIKKVDDQVHRVHKGNKRKEMERLMFQYLAGKVGPKHFDIRDKIEMFAIIDQALKDIDFKMDELKKNGRHHSGAAMEGAPS